MPTAKRPNILFCFADDWGRYASCYAGKAGASPLNTCLQTPAMDRMAREGLLCTNAFVPAPSCTPCRSSVLSGRYFWQTRLGAILVGAVWDRSIPSWPLLLEAAGYHIGFSDKVWSPGTPADDPYGGANRRYQKAGRRFGQFSDVVSDLVAAGSSVESAKAELYAEVTGNFDDFLNARQEQTPFCYWWGPTNTHRAWRRGSGKALWGIDPDSLRGKLPAFLPDVAEVREDVADYLGEAQAFDAGIAHLIARLEAIGELDNTLIVISGDHGIPGFPRAKCNLYDIGTEVGLILRLPASIPGGRVVDDFVNLMDLAPTFLEAAGIAKPPGMSAHSFWNVASSPHSGQVDPQRDWVVTGRERHVAAARDLNLPYPQRALRTATHLYIRNFAPERWPMGDPKGMQDPTVPALDYDTLATNTHSAYADLDASPTKAWMIHHRGEAEIREAFALGFGLRPGEELYDLRQDPDHLHNLAGTAGAAEVQARLSRQLDEELRRQGDPRVCEDDCRFEHSPYTDWPVDSTQAAERWARS